MRLFKKSRQVISDASRSVNTLVALIGIAMVFSAVSLVIAFAAFKSGAA